MVYKDFYLLGESPTDPHMVDIDIYHDIESLKTAVADAFSVVDPSGLGFQTEQMKTLESMDDILDWENPVAVSIDGHAVRDIPEPKGLPFLGSYLEVYPDHLGNHQRLFATLGSVIKHTDMGRTTYLTNDPAVAYNAFQESPFWSKIINENHPLFPIKNPPGKSVC